nr:helix-turn-helix transcriptional regulator [uncultured Mitsuokella sp.]
MLNDLCREIGISRSFCCRYFKQMMNMTISDYFLEYRLSQALNLLKNSDKAISEVALQSGFSTISYFISVFRKKRGVTPLKYKKNKIFLTITP